VLAIPLFAAGRVASEQAVTPPFFIILLAFGIALLGGEPTLETLVAERHSKPEPPGL